MLPSPRTTHCAATSSGKVPELASWVRDLASLFGAELSQLVKANSAMT